MEKDKPADKTLTRREFLIRLGGAAGAAVAGAFFGSLAIVKIAKSARASDPSRPMLNAALELRLTVDGAEIRRRDGGQILCAVNEIGGAIIEEMNGRNNLQTIAGNAAARTGVHLQDPESFRSGVASFIIELGKMGMLQNPYYVMMMASEVRT
jgi:hypothetical protein